MTTALVGVVAFFKVLLRRLHDPPLGRTLGETSNPIRGVASRVTDPLGLSFGFNTYWRDLWKLVVVGGGCLWMSGQRPRKHGGQ
jgi:hypothetical protein